jgi:DNA-binding MarR family transcriptional regulator
MALTVAHENGAPLNVSQAMQMRRIGSPAKNHRKINDLLYAGMIELAYDAGNRRTKFLVPTDSAMKIFDEMASAMAQAAKLSLSQETSELSEQTL